MRLPSPQGVDEFQLEFEDVELGVMRVRCFRFADGVRDPENTVVCIHGMAASGVSFARLRPMAARYDFRFLSAPVDGYPGDSVGSFAEAVREYLGRFDRPVLMGTSWGGLVSLAAAHEASSTLSGLVLTGAFARNTIVPRSLAFTKRLLTAAQKVAPMAAPVSARFVGGFGIDRSALRELTREAREVTIRERTRRLRDVFASDLRKDAESIHVPSIVIHGTADRLVTTRDARELADCLPDSTYREIEGAGHTPYLSHPLIFNQLLSEFLECRLGEASESIRSSLASDRGSE